MTPNLKSKELGLGFLSEPLFEPLFDSVSLNISKVYASLGTIDRPSRPRTCDSTPRRKLLPIPTPNPPFVIHLKIGLSPPHLNTPPPPCLPETFFFDSRAQPAIRRPARTMLLAAACCNRLITYAALRFPPQEKNSG